MPTGHAAAARRHRFLALRIRIRTERFENGASEAHHPLRTLAFTQNIQSNAFLVSPDGARLYSGSERLDTAANTLLDSLPASIATGASWSAAPIPGGPAISPDGQKIFCGASAVGVIDTVANTVTSTGVSGLYLSDLAVSWDGKGLFLSRYSSAAGSVAGYDAQTFALLGTMSGLGDFAGEVALSPDGQFLVAGSAGNPASSTNGKLAVYRLSDRVATSQVTIPLADNLAVSSAGEVVVSSGDVALASKAGIAVYLLDSTGTLQPEKTIFLGINAFVLSSGKPANDQIRRIVLKE